MLTIYGKKKMKITMKREGFQKAFLQRPLRVMGIGAICFSFVMSLGACSDDDDGKKEAEPEVKEASVRIGNTSRNMPASGTVYAQYGDSPTGSDIAKLVDNNVNTCYQTDHANFYVMYKADKDLLLNCYTVCASSGPSTNDPKAWMLKGSNDNAKWTTLDEQTGQTFSDRKEVKEFLFENEAKYRYYKLEVAGNNGGSATQISEWTLKYKNVSLHPDEPHSVEIDEFFTNMPTVGTLTAQYSDYPEGQWVRNIADGDNRTHYTTSHTHFYLLWEGDRSTVVKYYSLTSSEDDPKNTPSAWKLYASNDKVTWNIIDQRMDQNFGDRLKDKIYVFNNKEAYQYYKLDIEANNGGDCTQIAEWTLKDVPDIDDLMGLADGFSGSDLTPMGGHYANKDVATAEDREWLLNPENESDELYAWDGHWKEFPVTLYPYGKPLPADANQHGIGNCSLVAALASMAYIYPDFIKSLIQDNGDKTYTVSMFDPQGKPIKVCVSSKFLAGQNGEMFCCTGKDNKATWATVLEKAIMKWNYIFEVNKNTGGIGSEHVPPLFTGDGYSFGFAPGRLTAWQLQRAVMTSLMEGKLVIGGFNKADMVAPDGSGKTVTGHAWTLMFSADPSALFGMRNPWGLCYDANGKRDGVLNVFEGQMPSTIDLRIINPGIAAKSKEGGVFEPYYPPNYAPQEVRITPVSPTK